VGSFKYNPLIGNLKWPMKCMICGTEVEYEAQASISDISDSGLTWYTIRRRSIGYPVCKKHRLVCFFLDLPEQVRFVWTVLAFLPIALVISLRKIMLALDIEQQSQTYIMTYFIIISYALVFAYLFLSKRLLPVRLSHIENNVLKVSIKDEGLYLEVMNMNKDLIYSK